MWSSCQTSHIVPLLFLQKKKKKTKNGLFYKIRFCGCWHVYRLPLTDGRGWVKFLTLGIQVWQEKLTPTFDQYVPCHDEASVCHKVCKPASQSSNCIAGPVCKFYNIRSVLFIEDLICIDYPSQGQKRRRFVIIFHCWTAIMTSSKSSSSCYEDNINVTFLHKYWHWFWTLSVISSRTLANVFRFMTMQKKKRGGGVRKGPKSPKMICQNFSIGF